MPGKPLTAADVGPPGVIAMRDAGTFTVENAAPEPSAPAGQTKEPKETKEQKKARKAREKAAGM